MNLIHSKRMGALLAIVLAVAGCGGGGSSSTTVIAGTIKGTVTGSSGAPIAAVAVTAQGAGVPAAATGSDGKYTLSVPPGTYTLSFTGDNLEPATASSGSVGSGATVTVNQTMAASTLKVTVTLPAALQGGGPAGFSTTVTGITASAKLNGTDVTPDSITWSVTGAADGVWTSSSTPAPSPTTGSTTSIAIPDFETVRQDANAWLNNKYATTGTDNAFDYVTTPERDQLLSFGTSQVQAMSYKVTATVKSGGRTTTGSAVVSPLNISNGGNYQPVGMMVVANAAQASSYSWTLKYIPPTATDTNFGDPPTGVALQGAATKNPWVVPTKTGVYQLTNGTDTPLYFRVSTYHGVGKADTELGDDGVACASCHSGQYSLAPKFAAWNGSAHGNYNWQDPFATPMGIVQAGLDGYLGAHYSQSCMACHTDGYSTVPSATMPAGSQGDKGFYDLIAGSGWSFPTTLQPGNWDALPLALKHRAGIQCENCHGPLEPTEHSQAESDPGLFGLPLSPVASMDAGVCMVCHDALTHHDKGPLWAASPHAQTDLVAEAWVEGRGTTAAHCGRCHAAEGFKVYVAQQQAGTPGNIARPTTCNQGDPYCTCSGTPAVCAPQAAATCTPGAAYTASTAPYDPACPCKPTAPATTCSGDPFYYAYLNGLGLNQATAHSQTCQTCHDPHSTELRVDGDTKVTAAGFSVHNAGAGALCMICHNTRLGSSRYSDSALTSWSAAHTPSQGDIFAGRNAYFYGLASAGPPAADSLPDETAHKILGDTCVDCHVKLVPADIAADFTPAGTNHTFRSTRQVCVNCHGANIGDVVAGQVDDKLTQLSNALGVLFQTKLNAGVDDMVGTVINSDGTISDTPVAGNHTPADGTVTVGKSATSMVTKVSLSTVHGGPALIVTLADGTVFGAGVTTFLVGGKSTFGAVSNPAKSSDQALTAGQVIAAKSMYNWLFISGGGAHGFHNPSYVNKVLDATLTQIATVPSL